MRRVNGGRGCLTLHGVVEAPGELRLVMELCAGSLLDYVSSIQFDERFAALYSSQLLEAVAHCHARHVTHRDIKPDNLLVARGPTPGHLVLGDFGSACLFKPGDRFSAMLGSPFYASPECLQGDYDERNDVWSCGVVIISLLNGDLSDAQYYALHQRGVRAAVQGNLSADILDLLAMLLDRDVEARTSAAGALNNSRWLVAPGAIPIVEGALSLALKRQALEQALNVSMAKAAPRARAALAKALFDRDLAKRIARVAPVSPKKKPAWNARRKLRGAMHAVVLTNRIARHDVLAREDIATLGDLRAVLVDVVAAEDGPLAGALAALKTSDLPPATMLHVRLIQTGNVAGLGEGRRVSCASDE